MTRIKQYKKQFFVANVIYTEETNLCKSTFVQLPNTRSPSKCNIDLERQITRFMSKFTKQGNNITICL